MKESTQRALFRWTHLLFALPLVGFIYGPPAEVEPYRPYFQFVYFPVVVLSGLWMWKGPSIRKLFAKTDKP
ncbi:MAG: hypothetical protein SFU85_02655 [Candidatus Methylacidiphilales bacterium]|nr:hypothetical protein [Candidatus Methylacidiphilales bacterium]